MKKILFAFIFIGMTLALFYACKKDTDKMQTTNNIDKQYTDYEWEVFYKLQAFKQKSNSGQRSIDPVSLDSAEWYMESNFNVDEAYTEDTFRVVRLDTTYYALSLNRDEMVEYSDMNSMYNSMLSDLDSIEVVIADPYIFPAIGILTLESSTSSVAYFSLIIGFAEAASYGGYYEPITTSDNWRYGASKGKCGSTTYNGDAGQELERRLNNPKFAWTTPGSYIDYTYESITYDEYPDVNGDNPDTNVAYMVYYEETVNNTWPCIEYDELTFYLYRLHEIIYTYTDENIPNTTTLYGKRPPGKSFVPNTLDLSTFTDYNANDNIYWWEHRVWMWYGRRVNIPPAN